MGRLSALPQERPPHLPAAALIPLPRFPISPVQVAKAVMSGQRPPIPPPDQLPGGTFAGLDDYILLMERCWAQVCVHVCACVRVARACGQSYFGDSPG